MLKLGNLRIGKGIAIINRKEQKVSGGGTSQFISQLVEEFGIEAHRPHRGIPAPLVNRDTGDESDYA